MVRSSSGRGGNGEGSLRWKGGHDILEEDRGREKGRKARTIDGCTGFGMEIWKQGLRDEVILDEVIPGV